MEFLSVREFNAAPRSTREKIKQNGKIVLTNNGKPMALVLSVDSSNLEDTLESLRQVEDLRLLKSMRTEAKQRGQLTDAEIDAEIQAAREETSTNPA